MAKRKVWIHRPLWTEFKQRQTLRNPRRTKTPSQFNQSDLYRNAERILDAFERKFPDAPGYLKPERKAVYVEEKSAPYWSTQPLEPDEVGFEDFMWRRSNRHRARMITIYELAWALWLVECDHEMRMKHEKYEKALMKLSGGAAVSSLPERIARLRKQYPASAKLMSPSVVNGKDGSPILNWHRHYDPGLSYEVFKQMFKRPLHKQKFSAMMGVLVTLDLVNIKHHSSKQRRGNIYSPA